MPQIVLKITLKRDTNIRKDKTLYFLGMNQIVLLTYLSFSHIIVPSALQTNALT